MTTLQTPAPTVRIRAHPSRSLSSERVFFAQIPRVEPTCGEAAHA